MSTMSGSAETRSHVCSSTDLATDAWIGCWEPLCTDTPVCYCPVQSGDEPSSVSCPNPEKLLGASLGDFAPDPAAYLQTQTVPTSIQENMIQVNNPAIDSVVWPAGDTF